MKVSFPYEYENSAIVCLVPFPTFPMASLESGLGGAAPQPVPWGQPVALRA